MIEQCQAKANWMEVGIQVNRLPKTVYRVPVQPDYDLIEVLGAVKPRIDGRWSWWRWKSKYHKWVEGQGVAVSKEIAEMRVLEGWV